MNYVRLLILLLVIPCFAQNIDELSEEDLLQFIQASRKKAVYNAEIYLAELTWSHKMKVACETQGIEYCAGAYHNAAENKIANPFITEIQSIMEQTAPMHPLLELKLKSFISYLPSRDMVYYKSFGKLEHIRGNSNLPLAEKFQMYKQIQQAAEKRGEELVSELESLRKKHQALINSFNL